MCTTLLLILVGSELPARVAGAAVLQTPLEGRVLSFTNVPDVVLETEILEINFVPGDIDLQGVELRLVLRFTNKGDRPALL